MDVGQLDFQRGLVVDLGDRENLDLFDQLLVVGVEWAEAIDEVAQHFVRGRVAQAGDRVEGVQAGREILGVHALLRLVHDDDGADFAQRLPVGVTVGGIVAVRAVDNVIVRAEGVGGHDHDLEVGAFDETLYLGQLFTVIFEGVERDIIETLQLRAEGFDGVEHALADRHGGNENDKLGKSVFTAKFVDGAQVNQCFTRPRLHLNTVVGIKREAGFAVANAVLLDDLLYIGYNLFTGEQEAVGKAVAPQIQVEVIALLSFKEPNDGVDCLALIG